MVDRDQHTQQPKERVLGDYKKVGNTFVPPLRHRLGPWEYISWSSQTMPELIWWDVLMGAVSPRFAAKVAEELALYFKGADDREHWWAFISDYVQLDSEHIRHLKDHLLRANLLELFLESLGPFLDLYPECPLSKLSDQPRTRVVDHDYLTHFENRLEVIQDKRSRDGVLVQAQAVYMGFVLGRLHVMQGLALADFPEVEHYPDSVRSQEVGASICACVNMLAGSSLPKYTEDTWVQYFWRRSLELRPLDFDYLVKR